MVHKKTILNINTPAKFKFNGWKKLCYVTSNHKKAGISSVTKLILRVNVLKIEDHFLMMKEDKLIKMQ